MFVQLTRDYLGRKAGERIELSEADAAGLLAGGMATAVTDDVITPLVSRALEQALAGFTKGLDAVINETLRRIGSAQGQSRKNAVPLLFGEGGEGDPKKSFGDWCLAVARNDRAYLERHYGSRF